MMRGRVGLEFAATTVLLGLLVVLGTIAVDRRDLRVDVTADQRRTLAPQTKQILGMLPRPVTVLAFYAGIPEEEQRLRELVARYREIQPSIDLRLVDPDRRPDLAEEYGVTANGTVVLEDGDLRLRLVDPDEARLTAAFLRLLDTDPPVVMFTSGHGESSVEDDSPMGWSQAAGLLAEQNFDVRILATDVIRRIPPETELLVMTGPETAFGERELDMVTQYVARGGRVLAMLEPYGAADVDSLITEFGIAPEPGFLVDASAEQENLTQGGDGRIALALGGNPEHPITRDFTFSTLFPMARSLRVVQPVPAGVQATRLLETQPQSWSERGTGQELTTVLEYDPAVDRPGPLPLAFAVDIDLRRFRFVDPEASATMETMFDLMGDAIDVRDDAEADSVRVGDVVIPQSPATLARMVVIGDTDFASNANLRVQGNAQLLLASVLWLTQQEDRIALPPRRDLNDPIVLTATEVSTLRGAALVAAPLVFFAVGLWMLWRRRRWV